ncbi:AAA family ATPase [Aquincola sp. S2]|uniref:AAA family ATPase n=1 Tax=Pseudaquabacterium terrae TaxID=2732868 RepID=A0ABX2EFR3_9BURK|nr:AAA family ATPase [Aquabacterium terrae]
MTVGNDDFRQWLEALGLGKYAGTFADNDVGFDALRLLTDADLKELGLSLGHRRILQGAVEQLQQRIAGRTRAAPAVPGHGERRQITVMFCDLVGSSELSVRFDPEDLRSLIHAYYSSCCRIIEQSGGFIARIIGDGILAYFGYPAAREDAAECAIRAGLHIIESVNRQGPDGGDRIDVRIGLATGVSVISDMVGIGFSELHAVMGQTPNLASRIQSLVEPGTVGIADETRRLAGGFFVYADHGSHPVKGFNQPVQVWRVVGESRLGARFDAQHTAHVDCIGRDAHLGTLQDAWARAQQGSCRIVTLVGEAGIGKSRLLRTASERFVPAPGLTVVMQCAPSQATTPLHPLVDWLRRDIGVTPVGAAEDRARLEAWLGGAATPPDLFLLAEFLSVPLPAGVTPAALPPDRKRQLMREIVLRHFERHCEAAPALLMVEDAHWMDGATREFLTALFDRMRDRPLMAMVTSRPGHPRHWVDGTRGSELTLDPLPRADAEQLIWTACRGRRLPLEVVDQILAKTDGVPLFIEELTATIVESGLLREEGNALVMDGPLPALDIPSTLRDSLMARLDRLSDIKDVARIASALGREFTFSLLAQVSEKPTHQLIAALDRLVEAQLLFQRGVPPDAEYVFKHALVQQAAYDSQLRSARHALHARIVRAIETKQPEIARHEPGLMAHHCELAGMTDREVDYLYAAGLASTRIVAIPEALSYFSRADAALARLEPSTRNARRNIDVILGMMEVGRFAILPSRLRALSERARNLSRMDGVTCDATMTAAILFQDARAKLYSSQYAQARSIFQEIRQLGIGHDSRPIERKPASAFSMDLCCQGLFNETLEFINHTNIGYYKESGSFIDYISGLGWIAYASCQTGAVDDGLRFGQLSVHEAEQVQSQIYLAGAYIWRSHALMAARRLDDAVSDARQCVSLSTAHAVPYLGWHGLVFLALCQCRSGELDAAAQSLLQARAMLSQVEDGQWSLLDYLPAIEAEIACFSGDHARAMQSADEAIAVAGPIGGHFAEAIAWRAKAVSCIRSGGDPDQAQAFFDRAMRWHERGDAHAERTYSALVWAHSLQLAGHEERARHWANEAQAWADRHGFDLQRCEHGAAALLQTPHFGKDVSLF